MQLPPVKHKKVFLMPKLPQNKALYNTNQSIWKNLTSVVLKVNHRQGEGNIWTNCLNNLRKGMVTENDIPILDSRRLKNFPDKNMDDAIHAFGTNAEVDEVNRRKLSALPGLPIKMEAKVECPKNYKPKIKPHGTFDDTKYLKTLRIEIGAKVMLINNVSLQDKLVNGVTGVVINVVYHHYKKGEEKLVLAVVVKFNDPTVGEETRRTYQHLSKSIKDDGGVPIFFTPMTYGIPGRNSNSKHGATVTITQVPLNLGYAFTAHKLQGVTLKKGTDLYIHKTVWIQPGMAYVMLSRCEDIENVFLDNDFPFKCIKAEKQSLEETKRLEKEDITVDLAKKKFDIYYQNIASLRNKMEDLINDIHPQQSDVICLVETWLEKGSKMTWPGKQFHHVSIGHGKGVCMFTPENQDYRLIGSHSDDKFQILSIMKQNIQLILVYLSSKDCPYERVKVALSNLVLQNVDKIIIGDFNYNKNDPPNAVSTYLSQIGLKQIVDQPTQTRGNTIDHCYVSKNLAKTTKITLQFTYYSDHASLSLELHDLNEE